MHQAYHGQLSNLTTVETDTHACQKEKSKSRTRKEFPIQITNSVCVGENASISQHPLLHTNKKSAQTNSIVLTKQSSSSFSSKKEEEEEEQEKDIFPRGRRKS